MKRKGGRWKSPHIGNTYNDNLKEKDDNELIAISAQEKRTVSERCPNVYIARTMKHDSKRHYYYMTEDKAAMRVLRELRRFNGKSRKEM